MLRRLVVCLLLIVPTRVQATTLTLEELATRVSKLEAENQSLKAELKSLRRKSNVQRDLPQQSALQHNDRQIKSSPSKTWVGLYAGLGVSGSHLASNQKGRINSIPGGNSAISVGGETTSPVDGNAHGSGVEANFRLGYNWQLNSIFLAGIQLDASLFGLSANQNFLVGPCSHPSCVGGEDFHALGALKPRWSVSPTFRLGTLLAHDTLIYGFTGPSWLGGDAALVNYVRNSYPASDAAFHAFGFTVGGGIERKFDQGWSVLAEYRYSDYENINQTSQLSYSCLGAGFTTCASQTDMKTKLQFQSARLGINRSLGSF